MAILWTCPICKEKVGGSASHYGGLCDECSGRNEACRKEQERWAALTLEQKIEELKARLDSMKPAIDAAWMHVPIG